MKRQENKILKKIYRSKDIEKIEQKLTMLGNTKMDVTTFMNMQFITTILIFIVTLCISDLAYIYAPAVALAYYYVFYYIFIQIPLKKRIKRLDHEALYFFEILTLTLESGRNLERSLEVSREFKKVLIEMKFGKSLLEALEDMKKRMPSETINNILLNITQTDVFGNSILETMYNQINFLRDKQILEIKGEINKITNKISII